MNEQMNEYIDVLFCTLEDLCVHQIEQFICFTQNFFTFSLGHAQPTLVSPTVVGDPLSAAESVRSFGRSPGGSDSRSDKPPFVG